VIPSPHEWRPDHFVTSRHDWLEGRGPYLSLVGAIDDATGEVLWARFREQEDAQSYFEVMDEVVWRRGRCEPGRRPYGRLLPPSPQFLPPEGLSAKPCHQRLAVRVVAV
jgi:hypothetical protein